MRRASLLSILGLIGLLQSAWVVFTQTSKPPGPLRIERVRGDLYLISAEGGNVAVYVTGEGVVLVDDKFDRNHADILAIVKSVTDQPIRYVINTHQHDDHAGGDFKMLPIAEVVAHDNVRGEPGTYQAAVLRSKRTSSPCSRPTTAGAPRAALLVPRQPAAFNSSRPTR